MKRILSVLLLSFGLLIGLAACGGGGEEEGSEPPTESDGGGESTTVDVEAAKASFQQSCASCHGNNLRGEGNAPALDTIGKEHTQEEILAQIKNGGGGMPPNLLEGEEAENVAAWLASKK
ncbi:c-type cytochrome [Pseudalkalibacillus decolorationis]|uniref:c-type cytochrome n=1 Tax=Pseudalkalibacillus decolorationis TaxID=163879 RepID=UPI00214852F5|nr:cytochrome c [Pseudalkalibacillus decolorationis]